MSTFDVRRNLTQRQLSRATGAGIAVGAAAGFGAFYLAKLFLQRERLHRPPGVPIVMEDAPAATAPARPAPIIAPRR